MSSVQNLSIVFDECYSVIINQGLKMAPRRRTIKMKCLFMAMAVFLSMGSTPASAGYFEEGTVRASLGLGTGTLGDNRYFILGPGVGFFVLNGLELELDTEFWLGGDPSLFVVSPGVRYTVTQLGEFMPYVGGFYKHAFIKGWDDTDSLGARIGLTWDLSGRLMASGGVVYEHNLGCESTPDQALQCDRWMPELGLSFLF
jgi:hypothetical protein